jgi:hypothetical protein
MRRARCAARSSARLHRTNIVPVFDKEKGKSVWGFLTFAFFLFTFDLCCPGPAADGTSAE